MLTGHGNSATGTGAYGDSCRRWTRRSGEGVTAKEIRRGTTGGQARVREFLVMKDAATQMEAAPAGPKRKPTSAPQESAPTGRETEPTSRPATPPPTTGSDLKSLMRTSVLRPAEFCARLDAPPPPRCGRGAGTVWAPTNIQDAPVPCVSSVSAAAQREPPWRTAADAGPVTFGRIRSPGSGGPAIGAVLPSGAGPSREREAGGSSGDEEEGMFLEFPEVL